MSADTSAAEAALKAKLSRKRTKTGCLTCRKRRIKCGEERPVCKNCIKSKRQCEGYSQRVVFRPPTFDYRPAPHGGAHITFQSGPVPEQEGPYPGQYAPPPGFDPAFYHHAEHSHPGGDHSFYPQNGMPVPHGMPMPPSSMQFHAAEMAQQQNYPPPTPSTSFYGPDGHPLPPPPTAASQIKAEPLYEGYRAEQRPAPHGSGGVMPTQPASPRQGSSTWQHFQPPKVEHTSPTHRRNSEQAWQLHSYTPRPELQIPIDYQPPTVSKPSPASFGKAPSVQPPHRRHSEYYGDHTATNVPSHLLNAAAVEAHDDDYYDVQSDDEMEMDETSAMTTSDSIKQRRLTQLLEHHSITVREAEMRRYDTFIYDGILDHYRLDDHANPLRNRATAMVFAHFIAVTGPSLSIFERHLRSSSVLSEGQIPFPQQGLWTYTLPLAALRHRGLLHAMLALASLHIARLQNATQTPSMQHYSWAVKRIRHCVGHPKKRLKVTTIAASMLLGFYEIMTADHTKWNMHLAGSKQLFSELEFGGMVQQFRRMKRDRTAFQMYNQNGAGYASPPGQSNDELLDQMYDVDERMVSQIVGKEVKYEEHGHVMTPQSSVPPELDLSRFAMLKDLWWWYCKQDVYQSIVSGNPLL